MAETQLEEGAYYPRMARPYSFKHTHSPGWNPEDEDTLDKYDKTRILAENAGHLHHLKEHLEEICRVLYACKDNRKAYGHEIRNVLIVACTEVEAQWHGVLKANGFKFKRGEDRAFTGDYVSLLEPLRLNQYSVRFPYFPSIEEIAPFKTWDPDKATQSLEWYDAYNKVKHNREAHFKRATLINAFTAAAAYFVMLCAEHGWEVAAPDEVAARKFFQLKKRPTWEKEQCYKPIEEKKNGPRVFNKRYRYFSDKPPRAVRPLTVRKGDEPRMPEIILP